MVKKKRDDLEEYAVQGEPGRRERSYCWGTAIGLQAVDGIKPSDFLIAAANENISGDITLDEVRLRIESYYKARPAAPDEDRTEEADKVSLRITEILAEETFSFSPVEYMTIHRRLFGGIYKFAGKIRDYNITKSEWALHGATVFYASAQSIRETLEYDFSQEKAFDYRGLSQAQSVEHIAKFISGVWQIHAFGEGNTRTTAVFAIKYLRSFGFDVTNDIFAANAWYFRNALVRANYSDLSKEIHATQEYLNRFFGNLIFGENNILKNRELLAMPDAEVTKIAFGEKSSFGNENNVQSDEEIKSNDCTLTELEILRYLKGHSAATQLEVAKAVGKSIRTVKSATVSLQEASLLKREGAKKNGKWVVLRRGEDE